MSGKKTSLYSNCSRIIPRCVVFKTKLATCIALHIFSSSLTSKSEANKQSIAYFDQAESIALVLIVFIVLVFILMWVPEIVDLKPFCHLFFYRSFLQVENHSCQKFLISHDISRLLVITFWPSQTTEQLFDEILVLHVSKKIKRWQIFYICCCETNITALVGFRIWREHRGVWHSHH